MENDTYSLLSGKDAEILEALLERSGFSLLSITEALTDAAPAETSERIQFAARRNEE